MINKESKIFVAGHKGMVGTAIISELRRQGYQNIVTQDKNSLNLLNQADVTTYFEKADPDYVIIAAAKVGGIHANNTYPANFLYENLMIECNLIHAGYLQNVEGLLFLGSSCIYPKLATQPMSESELLTGSLEPTNEPYAIAKIAGIKLCESYNRQYGTDFRSVMPTNLYGPNDNFNLENSHVIPALIRKFDSAVKEGLSEVEVWGSGRAMREFLHVEDMASACVHVMNMPKERLYSSVSPSLSHINIGTGVDVTIRELAETVSQVTGFSGAINYNSDKPDGAPRKLLDISLLKKLGWKANISLNAGLKTTLDWYHTNSIRM